MLHNVINHQIWSLSKKVIDFCAILIRKWNELLYDDTYKLKHLDNLDMSNITIRKYFCIERSYSILNINISSHIKKNYFEFHFMRKLLKWLVKMYNLTKVVFHITIIICIILFLYFCCIMQSSDKNGRTNSCTDL